MSDAQLVNPVKVSAADVYAFPWEKPGAEKTGDVDSAAEKVLGLFEAAEDSEKSEPPKGKDGPAPEAKKADEEESEEDEGGTDDESTDESDEDEGSEGEEGATAEDETWELPDKSGTKVTRDEALKGYLRQQDYTRKTQAVAEERRMVETRREEYVTKLEALDAALAELQGPEIDWDKLQKENPSEYAVKWAEHDRIQKRRDAIAAEHSRKVAEWQEESRQAHEKRIAEEREMLTAAIPEWKDEAVAKKEKAELYEHALTRGFTEEQLAQVDDHRVFLLLRDAMLYQKGQVKQAEVKQKIKAKADQPNVQRPGTAKAPGTKSKAAMQRISAARARLAQSGSVEDAAALFYELID